MALIECSLTDHLFMSIVVVSIHVHKKNDFLMCINLLYKGGKNNAHHVF